MIYIKTDISNEDFHCGHAHYRQQVESPLWLLITKRSICL